MDIYLLEYVPAYALAYFVLIYLVCLVICAFTDNIFGGHPKREDSDVGQQVYSGLDGLRGLLAVGVFVHHTFSAYGYFNHGKWSWSSSSVLNQLGQATVGIFFMITGLLFADKVFRIIGRGGSIGWSNFFIARFVRLFPLYLLAVVFVFCIALENSGWAISVPIEDFASQALIWLTFVIFGRPDVNGMNNTWVILAGVNWSLKYEVLFYVFGVPALYFLCKVFGVKHVSRTLTASFFVVMGVAAIFGKRISGDKLYILDFAAGVAVATCVRNEQLVKIIRTRSAKFFGLVAIATLFSLQDSYSALGVFLMFLVLLWIAGGGDVWGVLGGTAVRRVGEVSYGIYLVHGLVIFVFMTFISNRQTLESLTLPGFLGLMVLVAVAVSALAMISYRRFEQPIMLMFRTRA